MAKFRKTHRNSASGRNIIKKNGRNIPLDYSVNWKGQTLIEHLKQESNLHKIGTIEIFSENFTKLYK